MRTHHLFKKPDTTVECKQIPIASESISAPGIEAQSHGTSQQDCLTIPRCVINGNAEFGTFTVNEHQYYVSLRGRDSSLAGCDDLMQQLHDNDEAKASWVPCQPDEIFIENKLCGNEGSGSPEVIVIAKNYQLSFGSCKPTDTSGHELGLQLKNHVNDFCREQHQPLNPYMIGIACGLGGLMLLGVFLLIYKALCQPRRPAPAGVSDEEANAFHPLPDENAAGVRPRL